MHNQATKVDPSVALCERAFSGLLRSPGVRR